MSKHTQLKVYRMIDGRRVPQILVIDSNRTVVDEWLEEPPDVARSGAESGGKMTSFHVQFATWTTSGTPTPWPELDDLRAAYFAERDNLIKYLEENGSDCIDCKVGAVMVKYRQKILRKIADDSGN